MIGGVACAAATSAPNAKSRTISRLFICRWFVQAIPQSGLMNGRFVSDTMTQSPLLREDPGGYWPAGVTRLVGKQPLPCRFSVTERAVSYEGLREKALSRTRPGVSKRRAFRSRSGASRV